MRKVGNVTAVGAELATLVIDVMRGDARLAAELAAVLGPHLQQQEQPADRWMDSRKAADYLGLTVAALHRYTAARTIPFSQDTSGGKCWFNRAELDDWRRGGGACPLRGRGA